MPTAIHLIENPGQSGWSAEPDPADAYYPDGRVASRGLALSPVTQGEPPQRGPDNMQLFQSSYSVEPGGGLVDDPVVWSREQGVGRSPGQQWPHMPKVEQYNFEATTGIAWHDGEMYDVPADSAGHPVVHKLQQDGWTLPGPRFESGGAYYYGQGPTQHRWLNEPISVGTPQTMSYSAMTEVPA